MRLTPVKRHVVRVASDGGVVTCTVGGARESANNGGYCCKLTPCASILCGVKGQWEESRGVTYSFHDHRC